MVFFVKQKTAYEMRISDWSSDVCSSDLLFIDSRYVLQAPAETDTRKVDVHLVPQASISGKVADYVPKGGKIGYDPWLHTPAEIKDLTAKQIGRASCRDRVWPDV